MSPTMTPTERVAERTWSTLGRARQLRVRFGEETLTDLLVLEMLSHQRAKGFWLRPTTKRAEASCGADLFVAVRHQSGRWSRLALQAKKLYPDDDRYRMLNRVQESKAQLEKLEQFARQLLALPLYLLYNHTNTAQRSEHWHCPKSFDVCQMGCTLVPSWRIRQMLRPRFPRNFHRAHKVNQSRPWRCAFDCPDAEKAIEQMAFSAQHRSPDTAPDGDRQYDWHYEPMEAAWPEWLFRASKTQLTRNDVDRIRGDLAEFRHYVTDEAPQESNETDERRLYPARFVIVDRS